MRLNALSERIWDQKYRLRQSQTAAEPDVEATWRRVARALAGAEADPARWEGRFYEALENFRFLPAGRILAGAGTGRNLTLFNCFVMGQIPDSLDGIFSHLREAALTLQQGGGIGYDFSPLRPRGAPVVATGADASGPLSFMDVWDAMCATVASAGARRGAMMATLRCDHPDIEAFVTAKRTAGRLTNFNLSVLVTDAFMAAVAQDADWPLRFGGEVWRTVRAKGLWDSILRNTYEWSEPGVIFIDRINALNNLAYCETIQSTNPCGEQPLPPYGACLLGSVNLAALVDRPFSPEAALSLEALDELARIAVRMLDNAIDVSRFPLEAQAAEARAKRRIGLGVTGLADALVMLGLRYDSAAAREQVGAWMRCLRRAAYLASVGLAQEKGPYPLFDAEVFLAGEGPRRLDGELREAIAAGGLRNGCLTSIAPTGTISLLANNLSSGLEPIFALEYDRLVLQPDGSRRSERVEDFAYALWREGRPDEPPGGAFVTAADLAPEAHLEMQAVVQHYVDAAVSKTINVARGVSFEDFQAVYDRAYALGCKGCTTYRPSAVRGSVLSAEEASATAASGAGEPRARPRALTGQTYKLRWPLSDHALYVTLNDIEAEDGRRPFEIFINSKNMEHYAWIVALTRMISAVFRRGGDVSFVVEELKAVFDPRGGAWIDGSYVPSLLAAIGGVIEQHLRVIGFLDAAHPGLIRRAANDEAERTSSPAGEASPRLPEPCPRCGQAALVAQEGCSVCTACGYSTCS